MFIQSLIRAKYVQEVAVLHLEVPRVLVPLLSSNYSIRGALSMWAAAQEHSSRRSMTAAYQKYSASMGHQAINNSAIRNLTQMISSHAIRPSLVF